ncbi:hypothetical protein CQW23_16719 [Capsicum baccatum]|uniref:Uncharacterized protein n=1 Tax=Capsicum baccatum TaxID=33114 RepID=A0A2G2WBS0_CAPBA|nr:hypothetical protein CQW23_16719 [Capsicum baccatum]
MKSVSIKPKQSISVPQDSGSHSKIERQSALSRGGPSVRLIRVESKCQVDIEYQRVPFKYATGAHLMVKVHESSKFPNYFAIALLNKGGLSDITSLGLATDRNFLIDFVAGTGVTGTRIPEFSPC